MRKFYFINQNSIVWGLNSLVGNQETYDDQLLSSNGFFAQPQGLGFSLESDFTRLNSFWVPNTSYLSQKEVTGTLLFGEFLRFNVALNRYEKITPYEAYFEFTNYLRDSEELSLIYVTEAGSFRKDIIISNLDKGEIATTGVLPCSVSLVPLSPWYSIETLPSLNGEVSAIAKKYEFTYDYLYDDLSDMTIEAVNKGSLPGALDVVFQGPVINPKITVTNNKKFIGLVEIIGEAESSSDFIKYSSRTNHLKCSLLHAGVETNLALDLDISNMNWLKLPIGANQIKFESTSETMNSISVKIYRYYKAV